MIPYTKMAEIRYEAEVVVVGGGLAGCCAAVAAARRGKQVLLIEQNGCLGGLATLGHVSPLDAVKARDGTPFGGLVAELLDDMEKVQKAYGGNRSNYKVGPHILKWLLLKRMVESHVQILFHTTLMEAIVEDDRIQSLLVLTKSGVEAVRGEYYIDASGDGDLMAKAGEEFVLGSEPGVFDELQKTGLDTVHFEKKDTERYGAYQESGAMQPVSIMFSMGNVEAKLATPYINKTLTYQDLGLTREEFQKLPYAGTTGFEENGDYIPLPQGRILFFQSGRPGEVVVNMSRVTGVDATDAVSLNDAEVKAQLQVLYLVDFLKRFVPGFDNAYLVESGFTLGVRESRRLVGQYVLKGSDAIDCVRFEDTIACGSYIIDIHDPFGKRKAIGGQIKGNCYGIPYRSLLPKRLSNLLVCGRCISVDHVAHASTRIQGTCMLTGQAAGTAAALAKNSFHTVNTTDLRTALMHDGVYLE